MNRILIQNVTLNGTVCDMLIRDGKIQKIGNIREPADQVIRVDGLTALPGLFDMHVHFRDPGLTYKEDIHTGAAAALAGASGRRPPHGRERAAAGW